LGDGRAHAFLLDTLVAVSARYSGIGTATVRIAADVAGERGCQWLHVSFEDHLQSFYYDRCAFTSTSAGVIALKGWPR
jgi:hypothetical protein